MAKKFDRMLEKATAPTLLEPDWEGVLNCVDFIRAGDVPVKPAVASLRKRVHNENPHVSHHALVVLEAAMKNCGEKLHKEIATKDFMEDFKHLAMDSDGKVKEQILGMIQCWAHAFRTSQDYKIICDTHNLMKLEGFEFPTLREADAMFSAESAPDWVDSDKCYRCREKFGLLTRKHHCRNCGQIFCDKCSSRYMILPHIGIEKEVRVCEDCHDKLNKKGTKEGGSGERKHHKDKKSKHSSSSAGGPSGDVDPKVKEAAIREREEEELELAIAMSQSEAEEKERQRQKQLISLYNGPGAGENQPLTNGQAAASGGLGGYKGANDGGYQAATNGAGAGDPGMGGGSDVDPELARYLNRSHWEQRRVEQKGAVGKGAVLGQRQSPIPTAPPPSDTGSDVQSMVSEPIKGLRKEGEVFQNGSADLTDTAQFSHSLKQQVEVFVNRIRSNQLRNRSIVNDSGINNIFLSLTGLHADVLNRMQALDDKKNYYEMLQDRLAHIQEARQAVDALRDEHERRRQAELLEAQRQRQIQMQKKLEVMRQKKHEMLEQQRLMALQRMQQQQQEIAMRRQMAGMALGGQQQMVMVPGPNGQMITVPMVQPGMVPGVQGMVGQPGMMYDAQGMPIAYPPQGVPVSQYPGQVPQQAQYTPQVPQGAVASEAQPPTSYGIAQQQPVAQPHVAQPALAPGQPAVSGAYGTQGQQQWQPPPQQPMGYPPQQIPQTQAVPQQVPQQIPQQVPQQVPQHLVQQQIPQPSAQPHVAPVAPQPQPQMAPPPPQQMPQQQQYPPEYYAQQNQAPQPQPGYAPPPQAAQAPAPVAAPQAQPGDPPVDNLICFD